MFEQFAFLPGDRDRPIEVGEFVVGDLHLAHHFGALGGGDRFPLDVRPNGGGLGAVGALSRTMAGVG